MDLSIIIVNWNSRAYVEKAIDAVLARPMAIEFEIIVVDSGSFDGCAEMLARRHPRVGFVQCERNVGFARANNVGFERSSGRVLLFLNPDTEVRAGAVERLHSHLASNPQAGIAGPTLLNSDGSVQDTCVRAFPTVLNQALDSNALRMRFPRSALWGKRSLCQPGEAPRRVDAVSGACLMMKRDVFESVGRFSTDYFMYAEDMDLCLKAAQAGFGSWHVPQAVVVHHGGASSAQAPANTFAAVMRCESQWRFFRKMRSPAYAALYRATICAASLLRLGVLLLAWPAQAIGGRWQARGLQALRKWSARLRWTLGGESWVRVDRGGPAVGEAGARR